MLDFARTQATAAAQTRTATESGQKRLSAARAKTAPVIDGILDEAAWSAVEPITDFVQTEPSEGLPASERTEVRLLYDDKMIYIGVICHDADPSRIVTTDSRRDSGLDSMDSFRMIFDTYHDRQNGFIFGTNVTGIEYDAQVRNEGESLRTGPPGGLGGGNAGGSGAGVNVNWDASWEVKTQLTATGWNAEFAIPLRTLRYGPPPQVWGINFTRNIQHKRETVYWSPISRIYTLSRLSSAGELRDLDVPAPRDFKLMPYTIGSVNRNFLGQTATDKHADWGIDGKIGVTSSMTLDLTYNTDFAQVEVDEQQINLTRFNLLFPEKRPFFLENRGLFAVGKSGEVDLFFSRRIGIGDNGEFVPIQGGARLTGNTNGINVGLMNMQTERVDLTPANNFTAVRVSKDLRNRSTVGGIFVNRSATGETSGIDSWNRTFGFDGRLGIAEEITVSGFAAKTQTPGLTGRDHAYSSAFEYPSARVQLEPQLHGSRRRFQSGGRVPGTARRLPAMDRRLLSERPHGRTRQRRPARMAAARQLRRLLGLRRPARDRDAPRRQRIRLRERHLHQSRAERAVRRSARAVRGVSGCRRAAWEL